MFFIRLIFSTFLYAALFAGDPLEVELTSEAAILINADTGAILYEKKSREPFYPASITKIATAYYALKTNSERLDTLIAAPQEAVASISEEAIIRSQYTLPSYWIELGSSHIGIKKEEKISLRDLLYGMMLRSGNDASNVIASYVGGTIPRFLKDLNRELQEIGCKQTVFKNPHGLHHPEHKTTAYDMAILTKTAMQNSLFADIVRTVSYTKPQSNKNEEITLVQTNKLLLKGPHYYPYAIGVKTGYTSQAQNTLVAAAQFKGRTLIAVLLKAEKRSLVFEDAIRLFEAAYRQPETKKKLIKKGSQKFVHKIPGANRQVTTKTKEELTVSYYPAEEPLVTTTLQWENLSLPVAKGDKVGELVVDAPPMIKNKKITLYAARKVEKGWLLWLKEKIFGE